MNPSNLQIGAALPQVAARGEIQSFIVMDVMRRAAAREAAGERVIHLEVGQPGTPAPRAAREMVGRYLERDPLGYTLALGLPALRERISRLYAEWYGIHVAAERIIVTTGSSGAFVLAFLTLFDAGDSVALPVPGYPCYRQILAVLGVRLVPMLTGPDTRWMPTEASIGKLVDSAGIRGALIASPAKPTGTMIGRERLEAIAGLCRERRIWLISDEIYHGLTYGEAAATALSFSDDAIVINSFSKYFSMTGWRVGWMVVPPSLVRTVERVQQNLFISPPAVAQVAALGAFEGRDELEANRQTYAANRALLLEALPRLGLDRLMPADGAFYIYADVGDVTDDSQAFCQAMLDETGVATTPGVDFDPERGGRFLRFSYSGSTADVAEAVQRLGGWRRLKP